MDNMCDGIEKRWVRLAKAVLLTLVVCGPVRAAELPEWIGYRGPGGFGIFRDAKPPLKWDVKTGENIRWRVPVANWGHSSPLLVRDRVFVVSEPGWKHTFPVLECFSAVDGKKLWEKELDPIDAVEAPASEREAARKAWGELVEWLGRLHEACYLWNTLDFENQRKAAGMMRDLKAKPPVDPDAVKAQWADVGEASPPELRKGTTAPEVRKNADPDSPYAKYPEMLKKFGWSWESWYHWNYGLACIGHTFGTPVTDGERVYVTTGHDACFCLDMEGKVLWRSMVKGLDSGDFCKSARSPILYQASDGKGIVISDINQTVRALDKLTGRLLWKRDLVKGYTSMVTPVVARVGDKDILLSGGLDFPSGPMQLHAFILPEGKEVKVDGWTSPGGTMLVKHDERDVVFFTGGGEHGGWEGKGNFMYKPPAAVRFAFEGAVLKATVLWHGVDGAGHGGHAGIVYNNGKFYANGLIFDAGTGKVLAGTFGTGKGGRREQTPAAPGHHLAFVANGHVYGMRYEGAEGVCEVYTLEGVKAAASRLPSAVSEGEKKQQILRNCGKTEWGMFSYSCAYTIGPDCLYVRSYDELWCIGAK